MIALLQGYDQPMIVIGFGLMVATAGFLIHAMEQRNDHSVDSDIYKLAFMRTKPLILGWMVAAFIFATGWAIPNPPTFAKIYGDCIWQKEKNDENINACIKHASISMQK